MLPIVVDRPTELPVSVAEAKEFMRVDTDDEDDRIEAFLEAATERTEAEILRPFVLRTMELNLDSFPCVILLKFPPVVSVDSINYIDQDEATQTLSSSLYDVDLDGEPARIVPALNQTWPITAGVPNAVTVTFKAGILIPFTANATDNEITTPGYEPSNGTRIRVSNTGGALPGGLSRRTTYYVVNADGETFQLSATSGGSAVDLTDAGSGTNFVGELPSVISQAIQMLAHHQYWERTPADPKNQMGFYRTLLDSARWTR